MLSRSMCFGYKIVLPETQFLSPLEQALERHFNGIRFEKFQNLVDVFLQKLKVVCRWDTKSAEVKVACREDRFDTRQL